MRAVLLVGSFTVVGVSVSSITVLVGMVLDPAGDVFLHDKKTMVVGWAQGIPAGEEALVARRGRPPMLSRGLVLAVAVEYADANGLSGLTMRAVADRLGVEAMSLYHYLPAKDRLLDALVEQVMVEVEEEVAATQATDGADWRGDLRDRFLAARRVMVRHPWAPGLIGSRTAIPPRVYIHYEAVLAAMVRAGFSYSLAHKAIHALGTLVLGFVQELFVPDAKGVDLSEQELSRLAAQLPHTTAMVSSEMHDHDGEVLGWCDSQAEFEFTINLLLDGLEARRASMATSH